MPMQITLSLNRIRNWGVKGGLAIADQGLFSGTNFVINIMLARWFYPAEYGAYSLSFAIYIFLTGVYIALILEPASVLGPSHFANDLVPYFRGLSQLHFIFCLFLSGLMLISGLLILMIEPNDILFARALLGNGLSLTFILLLWLVRRFFYIFQHPEYALIGSLVFSLTAVGGVYILYLMTRLTVFSVFIVCGFASIFGSLFALWSGHSYFTYSGCSRISWQETLSRQWEFGKWRTAGSFLAFTFGQMQTFVVAGMLGLTAVGTMRALQNFILPMIQLETAIEALGLPAVSRDFGRGKYKSIKEKSLLISLFLIVASTIYQLLLIYFSRSMQSILYMNKYSNYVDLVPILGLLPIILAFATGFTLPLLSIGKSQYYLVVYLINAPIAIILTVFLTNNFGLAGSVVSTLIPAIVNLLVVIILFYLWFPKKHDIGDDKVTGF